MRMFMACLDTTTNITSDMPTGMQAFAETTLFRGDSTANDEGMLTAPLKVWRRSAEERQRQVAESLAGFRQPFGVRVRAVYEGLPAPTLAVARRS